MENDVRDVEVHIVPGSYYDSQSIPHSPAPSDAGSRDGSVKTRRRKTSSKLASGTTVSTPAFDAFRAAFPNGPTCDPDCLPTDEQIQAWSENFLLAIETDMNSAEEAAWSPCRNEHAEVVSQLDALDREAFALLEIAQCEVLGPLLDNLDKQHSQALEALGNSDVPANWEEECTEKKTEYIENWTKNFNDETRKKQGPQRMDLISKQAKIESEVESRLKPHRKNAETRRSQHDKILKRIQQNRIDSERVNRAEVVGRSVIETVSNRVGDGMAGDAAVVATSAIMKGMARIQRRQTFYRFLRWAAFVLFLLILGAGGLYAQKTKVFSNLFKRVPTFRPLVMVESPNRLEPAYLNETPDPETDYDHFFWLRNTTGICHTISEQDFVRNSVLLPWSDGKKMQVTLTAVSHWLEIHAAGASCFCAQHIGLPVPAVRIVKNEKAYTMFNAIPLHQDYAQGRCDPSGMREDRMVRFESTVRRIWIEEQEEEEEGPPPEWSQTRPFRFWKSGMFLFMDVSGIPIRIYLDDRESACVTFCSNMCH